MQCITELPLTPGKAICVCVRVWCACRYRSEVQRLRNVFRSAVAGDVARLKEAVGEYKENTSRLECQKQLLLKQVTPTAIFALVFLPMHCIKKRGIKPNICRFTSKGDEESVL